MAESDVILITEVPEFRWVEEEQKLEFVLTSGKRRRTYWISEHKCRNAILSAVHTLDRKAPAKDNVRQFAHKAAKERAAGKHD